MTAIIKNEIINRSFNNHVDGDNKLQIQFVWLNCMCLVASTQITKCAIRIVIINYYRGIGIGPAVVAPATTATL